MEARLSWKAARKWPLWVECRRTFDELWGKKDTLQSPDIFTKAKRNYIMLLWRQSLYLVGHVKVIAYVLVSRQVEHIQVQTTCSSAPLPPLCPGQQPSKVQILPQPNPCSITVMWFERRVQLVILLVLTLASAASWMSFSHQSSISLKKSFCFIFMKQRPPLWVMWWCSTVTFGRKWAPHSAELVVELGLQKVGFGTGC